MTMFTHQAVLDAEDDRAFTFFERNQPWIELEQAAEALKDLRQTALFGCKYLSCSEEVSYDVKMLREDPEGGPVCENCYDESNWANKTDEDSEPKPWSDLPAFDPFKLLEIDHLYNLVLLDALFKPISEFNIRIKKAQNEGPST